MIPLNRQSLTVERNKVAVTGISHFSHRQFSTSHSIWTGKFVTIAHTFPLAEHRELKWNFNLLLV